MSAVRRTLLSLAGALTVVACTENSPSPTTPGAARFDATHDTTGGASQYTANGRIASASWSSGGFDSTGGGGSYEFGSLSVQDVNATRDEAVALSYYVARCDAFGCATSEAGFGIVPRSALSGNGGRALQLDVTPGDYPQTFTVFAGAGGPVRVTWTSDGLFVTRSNGNTSFSGPGFEMKTNGVSTSASAVATGVAGSAAIPPGAQGSMGTNHNVTLVFQH